MKLPVIDIQLGNAPLIINIPHDGREIPSDIGATMTADALALPDTLVRASVGKQSVNTIPTALLRVLMVSLTTV